MNAPPPLLLDVCGTLYAKNTSVAFLRRISALSPGLRLRWFLGALEAWIRRRLGARPGDCMRARLRMLEGMERARVRSLADAFVEDLERNHRYGASMDRLDASLAQGRETWLVSATLEEILEAIAARHPGVRLLGSRLEYRGEVCTGKYASFLLEAGKFRELSRHLGPDRIAEADFATDDLEADSDLVARSGRVFHVERGTWT